VSVCTEFCVACGGPALPKNRRVVKGEVEEIWAKLFRREMEKRRQNFTATKEYFMCRRCHGAYLKLVDTEKVCIACIHEKYC